MKTSDTKGKLNKAGIPLILGGAINFYFVNWLWPQTTTITTICGYVALGVCAFVIILGLYLLLDGG